MKQPNLIARLGVDEAYNLVVKYVLATCALDSACACAARGPTAKLALYCLITVQRDEVELEPLLRGS